MYIYVVFSLSVHVYKPFPENNAWTYEFMLYLSTV